MLLFISDLHLDPLRPDVTQGFYRFLQTTAQQAEALYILGDFFEVWLGDDDDTSIYREIIKQLKDYSQQHPVYFICGNRDFLVGSLFAEQAGLTLLPDTYVLEYDQQRYLLMHGDSLCTKDDAYMAFRQLTRSPQWQQELLAQPLEARRAYANEVRQKSKTMSSMKAEDIMDVTPEEVVAIMSEHQCSNLIHGHTHRPAIHQLHINEKEAQRVVLGDWGSLGWYASIDTQGLNLHSFEL